MFSFQNNLGLKGIIFFVVMALSSSFRSWSWYSLACGLKQLYELWEGWILAGLINLGKIESGHIVIASNLTIGTRTQQHLTNLNSS